MNTTPDPATSGDDVFAFIIHPINPRVDVARRYPLLGRILTERQIDFFSGFWSPLYLSTISGIRSESTGRSIRGMLIAVPYTPRRMLSLPVERVYDKIVQAGHLAERHGARLLGLGAFTSVVGDAGVTIARRLDIPVTTGDSYTVAIVCQSLVYAGVRMGIDIGQANIAIVGATGAIGAGSAQVLAGRAGRLTLIGRRMDALETICEKCAGQRAQVAATTGLTALRDADLILSVSSSVGVIIEPDMLRPGAVVCDAAVPRDVSVRVAARRDDVLVYEGGMVEVPGPVDFHFDFGYPPGKAYACMAETMALALEGRYQDYTLGRDLRIEQVCEIEAVAARHGFRLSGLRSFDRQVTDGQIARLRERAGEEKRRR
ncbi:MAG: shikimate dehydrogenase [Anaerolineae bacterium]|nr:shikimate dehydrogenase [Anaerolineae bacterium]